jgi:pimeloyl-ACP methyl ester carboxylesterase
MPSSSRRTRALAPRPATGAVAGALALALLVSGCSSDPDRQPAAPEPTLSPSPLPTGEPSDAAGGPEVDGLARFYAQRARWEDCRTNLRCATLEVPLDYADPSGATIELALLKVPASAAQRRVGSLVVNPGGPGGSGVDYAANADRYFGAEVRRVFDIVGFDPRGVGRSTPVDCLHDAELDAFVAADPDPDTPAEVRAADALVRAFGEGCVERSGALAAHVSTREAARDVDIIRAALGERRLNWFGASYGTFLGASYADLFPGRVGRMVLDGALDPTLSSLEMSLVQARGFETALRAYVGACVERGGCFLGESVDAGTSRIRRFLDEVERRPIDGTAERDLEIGTAVLGIWAPLYNEQFWPTLDAALKSGFAGNGTILLQLSDAYTSRGPDGYRDNSLEALYAINCLDHGETVEPSEVDRLVPRFERASPTFGAIFAHGLSSCAQWPVESADGGSRGEPLTAAGSDPILVVGTSRDPATPLEWATALARQLESGVLVTRDGDGHTGYHAGNACVDRAVEAYLVSGVVPADDVSC